ncbi:hypothetical protein ACYST8_13780 [Pseudomonas inefficax]
MATPNIEKFDQACGLIFAQLFTSFPQRIGVESALIEPIFDAEEELDWLASFVSRESFFSSTMTWLVDAGYIWCADSKKTYLSASFSECVLTPKALEALKASPASLATTSFGQSLKDAARSGALDVVKDLASQVIGKGIEIAAAAAISTFR